MLPDFSVTPPRRICVLRLSALGDVCHVLPVVRTLQDAWPAAEITWIIGKLEHKLLGHLPGIEGRHEARKHPGADGLDEIGRRGRGREHD